MTTRELREVLFHLNDQNMTVKELREMLFNVENQDAELEAGFSMWLKLEAERKSQNEKSAIS